MVDWIFIANFLFPTLEFSPGLHPDVFAQYESE